MVKSGGGPDLVVLPDLEWAVFTNIGRPHQQVSRPFPTRTEAECERWRQILKSGGWVSGLTTYEVGLVDQSD